MRAAHLLRTSSTSSSTPCFLEPVLRTFRQVLTTLFPAHSLLVPSLICPSFFDSLTLYSVVLRQPTLQLGLLLLLPLVLLHYYTSTTVGSL